MAVHASVQGGHVKLAAERLQGLAPHVLHPAAGRGRRSIRSLGGRSVAIGLALALGATACAPAAGPIVPFEVYRQRLDRIRRHDFPQTMEIVDVGGTLLAEIVPEGYRVWIPLRDVPQTVIRAVVATEDRTFYSNAGLDKKAFARAMLRNGDPDGGISGASTITMQLVRMVAFEPKERYARTVGRKVREIHLAAEVDEAYSKNEILEAYLNIAYFGRGAYGIEMAARRYFGVPARDVSLPESAFLAGLLQAPSALDPDINPQGARARQRVVLDRLVAVGDISRTAADRAFDLPLALVEPPPVTRTADHYLDYVLETLPDALGDALAHRGGFRVTTTIDPALTASVRDIAARHVARISAAHDVGDAAVVVVEPGTGRIRAMVGGLDYDDPVAGQVNAAARARQPGSAIKPIVYAAALEAGWTPASVVWDVPFQFPGDPDGSSTAWPVNYDGRYRGPVRLRQALANSLNAAAVSLTAEVGLQEAFDLAERLGVPLGDDPWRYGLSLALGGAEVPLVALTSALGTFGAGGRHSAPTAILEVRDLYDGEVLYRHRAEPERAVSAETAWLVSDILADDIARLGAFPAGSALENPWHAAVKTGTTNDFRDNLTVGWTGEMAVGVWVGNKDGRPMRDVLGITGAAPIWHDVLADLAARGLVIGTPLPEPPGMLRAEVCDGIATTSTSACRARVEVFAPGSPTADDQLAFGWFVAENGGACGARVAEGAGEPRMLVPEQPRVMQAVRAYATARGPRVALPPCQGGPAAAAPARRQRAPATPVRSAQLQP